MFLQCFCVLVVSAVFIEADPIRLEKEVESLDLPDHEAFDKFNEFALSFGKTYGSLEEYNRRFAIFRDNLKKIDRFNKEEQGTAEYGVTIFADLTYDEFLRNFTGGSLSQAELKRHAEGIEEDEPESEIEFMDFDRHFGRNAEDEDEIQGSNGEVFLPKKIDYRKKKAVTSVKNQGSCGSCWAFATITNIEGVYAKQKKKLIDLSPQELLDCDKVNGACGGGLGRDAFKELVRLGGVAKLSDYPYEAKKGSCRFKSNMAAVKIKGHREIPPNEKKIARALVKNGPLSVAVDASSNFQFYKSGVFDPSPSQCGTKEEECNHEVAIVGYGEDVKSGNSKKKLPYWIIKNSWGPTWGDKGYMKIIRGKNACAIATYVSTAYL